MNKIFAKSVVVISLLACVAIAAAQGPGGQGRGQGRGGGRGNTPMTLVMRKDVQADLGVTDDQVAKLTEISEKMNPRRNRQGGGAGGNGGNGGGGNRPNGGAGGAGGGAGRDPEAMAKALAERNAAIKKELATVLNDSQMKRLDEIAIQLQGNRAVLNPEVQTKLGLSADQTAKIKDLNTKMQEANRALRAKMQEGSLDREQMAATVENNNKTMDVELAKVLTADQQAKLRAMGGKPFVAQNPGTL